MLQRQHTLVPVTALAFLDGNVVLAGVGGLLQAFSITTSEPLFQIQVFDSQPIHGILPSSRQGRATVWGGRSFCILGDLGGSQATEFKTKLVDDWVLDAAHQPCPSDNTDIEHTALVTAHNALVIATTPLSPINGRIAVESNVVTVTPGSNCILYAAQVTWLSASQCLIASGTAFGDVVVWSCNLQFQGSTVTAETQVHYTFSAHEGSVFGVQLSPPLDQPHVGGQMRLLASCSDDRTIKIWDVTNIQRTAPTLTQARRDTGFGNKAQYDLHAPLCLAKAMGHLSRIWSVRFQKCEGSVSEPSPSGSSNTVIALQSFGEDASTIDWVLKRRTLTTGLSSYALEQLGRTAAHAGKHIWSTARNKLLYLATGGADGAIAIADGSRQSSLANEQLGALQMPDPDGDKYRVYTFIEPGRVVATTNTGKAILLVSDGSGSWIPEETDGPLDSLRGYSVIASVDSAAFISGTPGKIHCFSNGRLSEVASTNSKTAGIFTAEDDGNIGRGLRNNYILVTTVGSNYAFLIIDPSDDRPGSPEHQVRSRRLLFPSGDPITAFGIASCAVGMGPILFLGLRGGSIIAYTDGEEPVITLPSAHGKEAVTGLCWSTGTQKEQRDTSGLLFSTGRDGTLATHAIQAKGEKLSSKLIHQLPLPFGPNIEGLKFMENGHLLVWGFRSKHFVSYDITLQRDVMSVECGGAHRNFAFQPSTEGGTFIWTKASALFSSTQTQLPYRLIGGGGHGREIKATAVSSPRAYGKQLIATGAEDTDIKVFDYTESSGVESALHCLQTLRRHNTGIQHLQWAGEDDGGLLLFSSGGFEEFYVWRGQADIPGINIGFFCESKHPRSGMSDLRIMGFDSVQIETQGCEITMAYSDSTLKRWLYAGQDWKLLASGDYLTACLTGVTTPRKPHHESMSTATDGHLALWHSVNNESALRWQRRIKVHQNAILSMAMQNVAADVDLVATGGDDNAIGLTLLMQADAHAGEKDTTSTARSRTLVIPSAHAAAVTAISLVPSNPSSTVMHMISAGIDQRVKAWRIAVDAGRVREVGVKGLSVECVEDCPTPVADVSSLDLMELAGGRKGVLVCGVGMEVLSLDVVGT